MDERIRLASTDSVNSVNKKSLIDVEMQQHTKMFTFQSITNTIDQRELFEKEREESTKYRLILTINPYCTNVLFNALTEIVQNEGTDNPSKLNIASSEGIINAQTGNVTDIDIEGYEIRGKEGDVRNPLTNVDMVRNTEYSNGEEPFVYHCGFDIFNNHILRNQTFKLVNPIDDANSYKFKNTSGINREDVKNNFNTIRDIMRYSDGTEIKLTRRTDIDTIEGVSNNNTQNNARHLYMKEDILSFDDSINANLSEQNGWWGFNNRSSIPPSYFDENVNKWYDMNISRVINGEYIDGGEKQNHVSCEFTEMYPDSSLYSFNPKYNMLQNREEQNWDICITYPYENDESLDRILINGLISDEEYTNSLLLASYKQTKGTSGQDIILFRSFVKHNLHVGDKVKIFYKKSDDPLDEECNFIEMKDSLFEIINIGNLDGDYLDYYFYINDVNELKDFLELNENEKIESGKYCFRFARVVNGRPCKYYYRKFKKLPNLKFKKEELTQEVVLNRESSSNYDDTIESFEEYIDNNCRKNHEVENEMLAFSKEQYPLAFSNTIYGDGNTQVVFTDTIDIDKFTDNLGRPITELFVTIIKRNKGHDLWYKKKKTVENLKNIEFSHCFGTLRSGLEIHGEWSDDVDLKILRKELNDSTMITTTTSLDYDIQLEGKDHDIFYGDVVEFDVNNMRETVLSDVHFRFNTEQREHKFDETEIKYSDLVFDEIGTDDYDLDNFVCDEYKETDSNKREEGYYYKAHYPIKVREFGSMRQSSHKEIKINQCNPRQANGMFIEVVSSLSSGISSGDVVYLCDDTTNEMIPLTVNSVLSNVRFLLNPMLPTDRRYTYKSVFEIIEGLLHSDKKTITQEDIDNGFTWQDKDGIFHIASGQIVEDEEVISEGDENKEIVDYSNPKYVLRIKNLSIPYYAYRIGANTFLWRDILNVGNKDVVDLKEYPFANGHFYINKEINFFLKRQDPFNYNGLYNERKIPTDIFGNIKKETKYEYKDEKHKVC